MPNFVQHVDPTNSSLTKCIVCSCVTYPYERLLKMKCCNATMFHVRCWFDAPCGRNWTFGGDNGDLESVEKISLRKRCPTCHKQNAFAVEAKEHFKVIPWNSTPIPVLLRTFSYLDANEKLLYSQVCKLWHRLLMMGLPWTKVKQIAFHHYLQPDAVDNVIRLCPNLRKLVLRKFNVTEIICKFIRKILCACHELEHVKFVRCRFANLPMLLSVESNRKPRVLEVSPRFKSTPKVVKNLSEYFI